MYTKIKFSFLEQIMGKSQDITHLKLEPDLDSEPEKLSEHGTRTFTVWFVKAVYNQVPYTVFTLPNNKTLLQFSIC